jgi:hypothetical protein
MIRIVFALTLFVLALCHSAHGQTDSPRPGHGFSSIGDFHYNGCTYTYKLSTPDLDNLPSWNAQDIEPPLSLRKALDLARAGLQRFVKPGEQWQWRVDSIALRQLDFDKWIYDMTFSCSSTKCISESSSSFTILIKMDGSIIEPEIKPDEKRND